MDVNLKQEDNGTSMMYSPLLTMSPLPPYPDHSTPDKILFGDWSFSSASSNHAPLKILNSIQSQHSVTCNEHDVNSHVLSLFHSQSNADDPLPLTHDFTSPTPPSSLLPSGPSKDCQSHIPRPPNAFMLYRSDFLKRGIIPAHVERRQQNLSRIAGQCWNLLPPEEKAQWQERAAQALLEHQKRNPDYKFTPAPRGSRRTKVKGPPDNEEDVVDGEDRIRMIREQYAHIAGPTVPPTRRRRPRGQNRSRDMNVTSARISPLSETIRISLPPSVPPSPCSSISSFDIDTIRETPLPPFFPQHTIPHIIPPRRPSTSLGFATECTARDEISLRTGLSMTRPSSAASDTNLTMHMKDLDISPTVSTLHKTSSPASLVSSSLSTTNTDLFLPQPSTSQDEIIFPTLNPPWSGLAPIEVLSAASSADAESFLGSLYSNDAFAFNLPTASAEEVFASLQNCYVFDYEASPVQSLWSDFNTSCMGHMSSSTM
ncbi:hypothetical protein H2248_006267 [Termitomyces sp. 'cryptogamus']|nr:hypothetical protein H2248_006267 [Termitomyces sp. 'cryptogamus']